jgi:hypothetical protein
MQVRRGCFVTQDDDVLQSAIGSQLRALTHGLGVQRENLVEAFRTKLRELAAYWKLDLDKSLEDVRRDVAGKLRSHIDQLEPRSANRENSAPERHEQYRFVVYVGFNIVADEPVRFELKDRVLMRRHEWMEDKAQPSYRMDARTSQRELKHAIAQIEKQILGLSDEPAQDYVRRLGLYGKIDQAIESGAHVIGIVGDGGVGKSTLAKHYSQERSSGRPYLFADFRSRAYLAATVHESFMRIGRPADNIAPDTASLRLRELFADEMHCPKYVVLDNVEDLETIGLLGKFPSETFILITTRDELVLPNGAASVAVGELSAGEAELAIQVKLPDAAEIEREALSLLRGRILAIDIACSFLRNISPDDRREFTQFLKAKPVEATGFAAANIGKEALEEIYKKIIDRLEANPYTVHAVRLLELEVTRSILKYTNFSTREAFIHNFTSSGKNDCVGRQEYRAAKRYIARYHIGQLERDAPYPYYAYRTSLYYHPLTLEILTALFRDRLVSCAKILMDIIGMEVWRDRVVQRINERRERGEIRVTHKDSEMAYHLARTAIDIAKAAKDLIVVVAGQFLEESRELLSQGQQCIDLALSLDPRATYNVIWW